MKAKKLTLVGLLLAIVMCLAVAIGLAIPKSNKAYAATDFTANAGDLETSTTAYTSGTIDWIEGKVVIIGGTNMAVDSNSKSHSDGFSATKRLKLGATGSTTNNAVKVVIESNAELTVYAMSGSKNSERELVLHDGTSKVDGKTDNGNNLAKLEYGQVDAGTYYLYSANSGINIYGIKVHYVAACTHANTTKHDAVTKSCTVEGNIEYWSCNDCGKNFSDSACKTQVSEVSTGKDPHNFVEGVCSVCGAKNGIDEKTIVSLKSGTIVEDYLTVDKAGKSASEENLDGSSGVKFEGTTEAVIVVAKTMHVHVHAKSKASDTAGSVVIRSGAFDASCSSSTIVAQVDGVTGDAGHDYYVGSIPAGTYNLTKNVTATGNQQIVISKIALIPADSTETVETIALNKTTMELSAESEQLTATVTPWYLSHKTITWSSSNEAAATVANGLVTKVGSGSTTITASVDGKNATCAVTTATKVDVTSVTVNPATLQLEKGAFSSALTTTVLPANASSPEVTWSSSNEAIATVDSNGVVTAVAVGEANIIATADGVEGTCAVTVVADAPFNTAADCSMVINNHNWAAEGKNETWKGITVNGTSGKFKTSEARIQWNKNTTVKFEVLFGANANILNVEVLDQDKKTTTYVAGKNYSVNFVTEGETTSVVLDNVTDSSLWITGFKLTYTSGIVGNSVDLDTSLDYNLFYYIKEADVATANLKVNDKAVNLVKDDELGFYVATVSLDAKQIADEISAQLYVGDTAKGEAYVGSIKQYCTELIANEAYSAKEKAVANALLVYGAAAQNYFDYNTENLATETTATTQDVSEYGAVRVEGTGAGLKMSLSLESEITINIYNGSELVASQKVTAGNLKKGYTFTAGGSVITVKALTYATLKGATNEAHTNLVNALVAYANAIEELAK